LGQVVSKASPYGTEMRKLFITDADMDFVGVDFSGLELRVLAHYMSIYDNGNFKKTLLTNDIHTANQKAIGLSTRDKAKTFVYAYIYGAGNQKLSDICDVSLSEGKRLRENFENNLPALKTLTDAVKRKYRTQGWVKGLDGRKVICRSEHSALNTLIQGAGSLIVKMGTIILNEDLHKRGFVWGKDYAQVLHVHDEMQYVVKKDKVEKFKKAVQEIFNKVQIHFNFRCPLAGEVKIGQNWSDTH
jgi:DNA polymerase I-like protein with 3'-5' exonuclease and polymerase domains